MEAPRLRVTFGALRCFTVADLRRDLTRLSPALERRLIARSRFRTTHRSGSIWLNGSGRKWGPGKLRTSSSRGTNNSGGRRFGSKADIQAPSSDVRFTPKYPRRHRGIGEPRIDFPRRCR